MTSALMSYLYNFNRNITLDDTTSNSLYFKVKQPLPPQNEKKIHENRQWALLEWLKKFS